MITCRAQSLKVWRDASVRQFDSTSLLKICWLRSLGSIMKLEYLSISCKHCWIKGKKKEDIPHQNYNTCSHSTTLQTLATQRSMRDGHRPGPSPCPLRETSELMRGSESRNHFKLLVFENLGDVWGESPSSTNWLLFLEQTPPMIEAQDWSKSNHLSWYQWFLVLRNWYCTATIWSRNYGVFKSPRLLHDFALHSATWTLLLEEITMAQTPHKTQREQTTQYCPAFQFLSADGSSAPR